MPRKRQKNKRYSAELKIAVVEAYLSGKGSMADLTEVFQQARNAVLDSLLRQIAMVIESLSGRVLREERFI